MAEAVKKEQTEGETVSLDNMKDLKGKKGANLIVKILAMVLMPMLVIIIFCDAGIEGSRQQHRGNACEGRAGCYGICDAAESGQRFWGGLPL